MNANSKGTNRVQKMVKSVQARMKGVQAQRRYSPPFFSEFCWNMKSEINLERFITAQEASYGRAFAEIKNGRKESHWMWYIFPQIQGLGFSDTAKHYAIHDIQEAEAFLEHPVLGERLIRISSELLKARGNDALEIFGSPDNLKLKSCLTLFAHLNKHPVFNLLLDKFFQSEKDRRTLDIITR